MRLVSNFCLILLLCLGSSWAHASNDSVTITDTARRHFEAGVAYIDDPSGPKYDEALQAFRAAYAESPAAAIMNNIGLCALNWERDGEAIEAYQIYLASESSEIAPKHRKQLERDLATLKASLVSVTLTTEPEGVSILDERRNVRGELLFNRYKMKSGVTQLGLHPGHHKLTLTAPGYKSAVWEFDAEPASVHSRSLVLDVDEPKPSNDNSNVNQAKGQGDQAAKQVVLNAEPQTKVEASRTLDSRLVGALIVTGVFAAATTTTGVWTLVTESNFNRAEDSNNDKLADRLSHKGERLALITDIGLGATFVGAALATYAYVSSSKSQTEKRAAISALKWSPTVGHDRLGVSLQARF